MPRNGSGTYSLPESPFTPGTTISSTAVNSDFSDIATALTASIAANGETPITGVLKFPLGSVSAPSHSFQSNTDTGMYSDGTDLFFAVGGSEKLELTSTGATVTGNVTVSNDLAVTNDLTVGDDLNVTDTIIGGSSITATTSITAGTQFLAASGSVAAPGYAFTGDLNNGIYRLSDNVLGITCGTTKAVEIGFNGSETYCTVTSTLTCNTLTVNSTFSNAASQADMEAGSNAGKLVTPAVAQYHPSAAKCWLKCDQNGNVSASYNITSISDTGVGALTVTIATDFSSANYAILGQTGSPVGIATPSSSQAAGSFAASAYNTGTGGAQDSTLGYFFACFGDQ